MSEILVKSVLVCYTQGVFDNLPVAKADTDEAELLEEDISGDFLAGSSEVAALAENLVLALRHLGTEAETVKVPLRSYAPRDLAKAAFAWRLLDLSESNNRPIEMVICLDFPAWSISHFHKVCWVLSLPFFTTRQQVVVPFLRPSAPPGQKTGNGSNQPPEEAAVTINSMLQAERKGLAEAKRILAAQRPVAEELARGGILIEYNPIPSPESEPAGLEWQKTARRFLI